MASIPPKEDIEEWNLTNCCKVWYKKALQSASLASAFDKKDVCVFGFFPQEVYRKCLVVLNEYIYIILNMSQRITRKTASATCSPKARRDQAPTRPARPNVWVREGEKNKM